VLPGDRVVPAAAIGQGPKVVSLDLTSGAVAWSYHNSWFDLGDGNMLETNDGDYVFSQLYGSYDNSSDTLPSDAYQIFGDLQDTDTNIIELGAVMLGSGALGASLDVLGALGGDIYTTSVVRMGEWGSIDPEGYQVGVDMWEGMVGGSGPGPFSGPFTWGGSAGWTIGCLATSCYSNNPNSPNQ